MRRKLSTFACALLYLAGCAKQQAPLATPAQLPALQASDPVVTFSTGGLVLNPFSKREEFKGCIFVGNTCLVYLKPLQYATISLPPGVYTFSANRSERKPSQEAQGTYLFEAGKQYFVQAETLHQHHIFEAFVVPLIVGAVAEVAGPVVALIPIPRRKPSSPMKTLSCESAKEALKQHFEVTDDKVDPSYRPRLIHNEVRSRGRFLYPVVHPDIACPIKP